MYTAGEADGIRVCGGPLDQGAVGRVPPGGKAINREAGAQPVPLRKIEMSEAYLVLITWPDGKEGLLFPKPGNVPLNCMRQDGIEDFEIAVQHLKHMAAISSN